MRTHRRHWLCAAALATLSLNIAQAQNTWPDRPIRVVVPYTPGGGTDTITRHLVDKLVADTKWTLIVDNKPGAGGNVGLDMVAKAKADGYTIGMGQTANLAINPALLPKMPFDPTKDLVPVALVAEQPTVMVVRTDSPYKNLTDLVKAARAKPEQLRQALAGNGTVGHLAGEMLALKAGFTVINVPYKGAAPAVTDLLGGQTDYMFATPQAVLGLLKTGKLRALAVTSTRRLAILPDVPTVTESGYKGFEAVDWKLVVAPAGTPAPVVKALNAAIEKALAQSTLQAQLNAEGSAALGGSPEKVAEYLRAEQAEWATLIRTAKIKLD
jgi:tripartite-type tricarboxylate transporter receptor subunit TctC